MKDLENGEELTFIRADCVKIPCGGCGGGIGIYKLNWIYMAIPQHKPVKHWCVFYVIVVNKVIGAYALFTAKGWDLKNREPVLKKKCITG